MTTLMKRAACLSLLALAALPLVAQDATPAPTAEPMATLDMTPEMSMTAEAMSTPEMQASDDMMMDMGEWPAVVEVKLNALYPEGVEFDPVSNRFLVSSVTGGRVYAVDAMGVATPLVVDDRLPATFGLEVDEERGRLLVVGSDQVMMSFLGIYDLATGENLAFVDFTQILPNEEAYFANDVTLDSAGNAYVTDSFAGVIYRVDPAGAASVWLEHESFSTDLALNGLVYQPEGDYIVAVRVPMLIKIPVTSPAAFTEVMLSQPIPNADGVELIDAQTVAVVSNALDMQHVYRLESTDDFGSATITGVFETGNVFPTTATLANGRLYVLHAHLNDEEQVRVIFPIQRVDFAAGAGDMGMTTAEPEALVTPDMMATMEMAATAEATSAP